MAWDIILKSFGVILALMVVAQVLYFLFGDTGDAESGDEQ